ncbi:MAG: uracil-DNA glycosylase family protein [Candidatus Dormibacteria bacterium]
MNWAELQPAARLDLVARRVRECRRCALHLGRLNAVPGTGPHDARIMLVGEGPGAQEDQSGEPFVGAAGHLLDELLAGIGLSREQVFITNVVKCRPPGNRDPEPDEVRACSRYLDAQLDTIRPLAVVILGRHALARLLPSSDTISRVHGRAVVVDGVTYIPVYHPAAALHNPHLRSALEADFAAVREHVDRALRPESAPAGVGIRESQMELL